MTNKDKYQKIFVNVFDVNVEMLDDSFTFDNIDAWDSLAHLTLISEIESEFDIFFNPDDIINFGGYVNGMRILSKYGVCF